MEGAAVPAMPVAAAAALPATAVVAARAVLVAEAKAGKAQAGWAGLTAARVARAARTGAGEEVGKVGCLGLAREGAAKAAKAEPVVGGARAAVREAEGRTPRTCRTRKIGSQCGRQHCSQYNPGSLDRRCIDVLNSHHTQEQDGPCRL